MESFIFFGVSLFGLIIGSFLTACVHRVPQSRLEGWLDEVESDKDKKKREELIAKGRGITISNPPRSFCPACNKKLVWWENIPLISWMILGGKCSGCKTKIPIRYPLIELLSFSSALLSLFHFGFSPTALVVFIFCAALIVITFIDYDYFIIPDVISIPGTFIGLGLAVANEYLGVFNPPVVPGIRDSLLGIVLGAGFLYAVATLYLWIRKQEGLGMGDVKLLAMVGATFGIECVAYTIFVGSLLGSIIGLAMIIFSGFKASHPIPFGPYLATATFLYLFTGMEFVDWFLTSIRFGLSAVSG